MGLDNGSVGLCRLQFGGEALRPDGLFGVILPSFILLTKEMANELLGALRDVRERGPSESEEPKEASSLP